MTLTENVWDEQVLWAKSKAYMDTALQQNRESWLFPFWASLSLELLARTALSHRNPVLLADTKGEDGRHHIFYALNHSPKSKNYSPKSIGSSEVFGRCEDLIDDFTSDQRKLCNEMLGRRNAELHSGGAPFHDLKLQSWLPRFYECCSVLLKSTGRELAHFLGEKDAHAADEMITAMNDKAAMEVMGEINARKKAWDAKSPDDRASATESAAIAAKRAFGHVVSCPACGSNALLRGEDVSVLSTQIEGDEIVSRTIVLPNRFECTACGLIIKGHNRIHAAGLGSTFTRTQRFDPVDYYSIEESGSEPEWEEDNNE